MLQQCFCIIGEKKLQKMLPDVLKVTMVWTLIWKRRQMMAVRWHLI